MCGICGVLYFDLDRQVEQSTIEAMNQRITHRGPDREGIWTQGRVGLGHRRLSIIDLSPCGAQPMFNEDKTIAVVFNGEVYNFPDLRKELLAKGHRFESQTDTETIIHLYEEEGPSCVKRLRGMFAFALWDSRNQRLLLARDRLGKKPLKYSIDRERIVFASELKAILALDGVPREEDPAAIHQYLTYGYCPDPLTGFKQIRKLPPAHWMIVEDGRCEIKRYWQLSYERKEQKSESEWREEIVERLREAVRIRLVSDVPLGVFLSGGIDSSAVTALMSQTSNARVKTFSIGFSYENYNELPYARLVAQKYDTEHHEFTVEPNAVEILPKLLHYYEEPYADHSAVPSYYLAQMARRHVTVALNGDGGDENFAGYSRYLHYQRSAALSKTLALLGGRPVAQALSRLSWLPQSLRNKCVAGRRMFYADPLRRYLHYIFHLDPGVYRDVYTSDVWAALRGVDALASYEPYFNSPVAGHCEAERAQYADLHTYLPGDLLPKMDIASMANSLESRAPLLDHEFMEFTATIPFNLKVDGATTKAIFKKAVAPLLPSELLQLPKRGFGVPLDRWFSGELGILAHDYLLGERCLARGWYKKSFLENLFTLHAQGVRQGLILWSLICLEEWRRQYIDR